MKQKFILRSDLQKFNAIEWLKNHQPGEEKTWEVIFQPHVKRKTMSQRNYWHLILSMLAEHCGYTKGEMKDELKRDVLGTKVYIGLDGKEHERVPSSEELGRNEYSALIDRTIQICADNELIIPDHRYE